MSNQFQLSTIAKLTNNTTLNIPLSVPNIITTGSNYTSLTPNVTASWQQLDQGNNKDLLVGIFTNLDNTSSIYIALGNTGSVASILNPNTIDNCLLCYSGSTAIYAKSVGGNPSPQLNYTIVSMN